MSAGPAEAPAAFEDSRRLPGPNRWSARPAVVLTALTAAAQDGAALAAWAQRVQALCHALGWPAPAPQWQRHGGGATLAFAAPEDVLFTATEVNEWAWERCAAEQGALAAEGITPTMPTHDDIAVLAAGFGASAALERSPPLIRLKAAAARHGLPLFDDDDCVSVGAGAGSRCWPRAALPLAMDVPWAALHDIPTLLVTGSNGKTTTTRLLMAMATAAGRVAGGCSTEGVIVGGATVHGGDYAGPAGARAVLRHPAVQFAVLETARGGILRRGLAVQRADASVVTNVSADHLGEYGVASLEDIAEAKLVVAHAVAAGGLLVLNADDTVLMAAAARLPFVRAVHAAGRVALFARDADTPALVAHRAAGGATCGVRAAHLVLARGDAVDDLGPVTHMPLTLAGTAGYNVANIAAAVLAASAARLPLHAVRHTLLNFGLRAADNPGRLERWLHRGATVLVDYAHNPDGLAQLLGVARALLARPADHEAHRGRAHGRLGLLLGQAGNRDDAAITALARAAASAAPDRVVIKELPAMLRGRLPGEVTALLQAGLLDAGLPAGHVQQLTDEGEAALALLAWAQPGDVLVLAVHTSEVRDRLTALLAQPAR